MSEYFLNTKNILNNIGVYPGMHFADFGIGVSGHIPLLASKYVGENGKVYAVDILQNNLKMLQNRCAMFNHLNIDMVWGDYESFCGVPIRPNTVDIVTAIHVLRGIENATAVVQEARRLLKSSGKFIVIDWTKETDHGLASEKSMRKSVKEFLEEVDVSGFKNIEMLTVDGSHWGLSLVKS